MRLKILFGVCALALNLGAAADDGPHIYAEHCASCHDSGAPRTPTRDTLQTLSPDTIVQALETGAMRVIGQWSLDGPQRIAVAEFLSGKTYDPNWQTKTSNLCTHKLSASDEPFASPHWNGWGVNNENTRFQSARMAGLEKADIAGLSLKWVFAFPAETVVEAQP